MSGWSVFTAVAVWTLLIGSVAVFAWFLAEVVRIARRDRRQRSSRRSSSMD